MTYEPTKAEVHARIASLAYAENLCLGKVQQHDLMYLLYYEYARKEVLRLKMIDALL